jgi:hypothetical protein
MEKERGREDAGDPHGLLAGTAGSRRGRDSSPFSSGPVGCGSSLRPPGRPNQAIPGSSHSRRKEIAAGVPNGRNQAGTDADHRLNRWILRWLRAVCFPEKKEHAGGEFPARCSCYKPGFAGSTNFGRRSRMTALRKGGHDALCHFRRRDAKAQSNAKRIRKMADAVQLRKATRRSGVSPFKKFIPVDFLTLRSSAPLRLCVDRSERKVRRAPRRVHAPALA